MRLVVTEFVSLDGVAEDPHWTFPYWTDATSAFKQEETERSGALLLGRRTYEEFAKAWPQRGDADGGSFFNPVKKHVVTSTLTEDVWQNASFLPADRKAIERLKATPGKDLVVHGSLTLARWLLAEGLVDELRLLVYPVLVGRGKRLFDGEGPPAQAKLDWSAARRWRRAWWPSCTSRRLRRPSHARSPPPARWTLPRNRLTKWLSVRPRHRLPRW